MSNDKGNPNDEARRETKAAATWLSLSWAQSKECARPKQPSLGTSKMLNRG